VMVRNEWGERLLSDSPIVDPVAHSAQVQNKPLTIPELAEGAGWQNDVILVNTSEDEMHGEVRFLSPGSGNQPGAPMEVTLSDGTTVTPAVEFNIPARGYQKVSTNGSATRPDATFSLNQGTSIRTRGGGAFQITGWASADSTVPDSRLNGLQLLEFRQLGITQSQTGAIAPSLRATGAFSAEITDKI